MSTYPGTLGATIIVYDVFVQGYGDEKLGDLTIRATKSTNTVTAIYSKDEATLELVIRLPPAYPLRPAEAECSRRMGVSEGKLRKWLLSISGFLRNQNGAVAEALFLWKEVWRNCCAVCTSHTVFIPKMTGCCDWCMCIYIYCSEVHPCSSGHTQTALLGRW